MNEDSKQIIIVLIGILLFTSICFGGGYVIKKIKIDNFQNTIKDLSDEQKCMHICGFEWHNAFENYKFCLEKCDRISERENGGCLN